MSITDVVLAVMEIRLLGQGQCSITEVMISE